MAAVLLPWHRGAPMRRPRRGTTGGGALASGTTHRCGRHRSLVDPGRPHPFGLPAPRRNDLTFIAIRRIIIGPALRRESKVLRMPIHSSVLELIGQTPIVKAQRLDTGVCELYLKLRAPTGRIDQDRIGLSMIEAAEQRGDLKPGATLVEGTAGNTGLGLALVAQQKGYKLILVVPDKMSREKIFNLKAMGAEVRLTRSDVAKGHPVLPGPGQDHRRADPGAYFINQFGNPDNPAAHEFGTGRRSWSRWGDLDAIVFGCGSGTMTGLSRAFAKLSPKTELVLADPVGSILAEYINDGVLNDKSGSWLVEGIGEDFLPSISDFSRVKKAYAISDAESFRARAAGQGRHPGRFVHRHPAGRSAEVLQGADHAEEGARTGLRYRQQVPVEDVQRLLDAGQRLPCSARARRPARLDPASVRPARHCRGPNDLLTTAYQRMKLYDVSQLPVMDGDQLVGIVDGDVLLHVYGDEARFRDTVATAMVSKLDRLDVKSPIEALLPVFDRGQVAIVMDGDAFLGLITRIDLLNYLRRRVQ